MIRRIDFREGPDLKCCILGHAGLHTKAIQEHTGLSGGQVSYRLKLAAIRRKDYRNGESDMSQLVIRQLDVRGNVKQTNQVAGQVQRLLAAEERRLKQLTIERLKKVRGKKAAQV